MKKILSLPDIHQDLTTFNNYKDQIDDYDYFIIHGDYVDSFGERLPPPKDEKEAYSYLNKGYIKLKKHVWYSGSDYWWLKNDHNPIRVMETLVDFKTKYPEKVKLLIGNHDFGYHHLTRSNMNISGHQTIHQADICDFFIRNKDSFDVSFYSEGIIFSHAGFSDAFIEKLSQVNDMVDYKNPDALSSFINSLYHHDSIDLSHCSYDPYGNSRFEGPLWIRPESLVYYNAFPNFWQIVGHSEMKSVLKCQYENNKGVLVIDSFDHSNALDIECDMMSDSYVFTSLGGSEINHVPITDKSIEAAHHDWSRWRNSFINY